eukprot:72654-Pyramimonas_sp.AAC.1
MPHAHGGRGEEEEREDERSGVEGQGMDRQGKLAMFSISFLGVLLCLLSEAAASAEADWASD